MQEFSIQNEVDRLAYELHEADAPRLGVHVMSEFIYCPRAGIVAAELDDGDRGTEFEKAPALGGLPTHDLDQIRHRLAQISRQLKSYAALAIALAFSMIVFWMFIGAFALGFLPVFLMSCFHATIELQRYRVLRRRLKLAESAASREPNWDVRQIQSVKWWNLIAAKFESVEYRSAIMDDALQLVGKPWRVLRRGSVHYPVLVIRPGEQQEELRRSGRFSQQQLARIAAYAYLLIRQQNTKSDWAIILFGKTYEGVAIPLNSEIWDQFERSYRVARSRMSEYLRSPIRSPKLSSEQACLHCPFGKPIVFQKENAFANTAITAYQTKSTVDNRNYHSLCGDRFRWVAPHERAQALKLL